MHTFQLKLVAATAAFAWVLASPASALAIGGPPGGFVIPAGATATFNLVQFNACNPLDWGYQLGNGAPQIEASKLGFCGGGNQPDVTIGPFAQATSVRVFLDDNQCGTHYFSDGSPVDHVEVTGANPYTLNFADSGAFCERLGTANDFGGFNLTVTLTISAAPDSTPPTVRCGSSDGSWHGSNVSISCTASDDGSGLANPADASFALNTNVAAGAETANAATDSRTVCDLADNCTTAGPIGGNMIDEKGPSLTCASALSFALDRSGATVSAAVVDAGSGVRAATVSAVADTSSVGAKTINLSATDNVGNSSTLSCGYGVGYVLSGFAPPLGNGATVNTGKAGRTYPIKWRLADALGNAVGALGSIVSVDVQPTSCSSFATDPNNVITATATGGTSLRYDSGASQYIYNWATPGAGCYTLFVELNSGQALHAFFQLS